VATKSPAKWRGESTWVPNDAQRRPHSLPAQKMTFWADEIIDCLSTDCKTNSNMQRRHFRIRRQIYFPAQTRANSVTVWVPVLNDSSFCASNHWTNFFYSCGQTFGRVNNRRSQRCSLCSPHHFSAEYRLRSWDFSGDSRPSRLLGSGAQRKKIISSKFWLRRCRQTVSGSHCVFFWWTLFGKIVATGSEIVSGKEINS
jgi:hypothetical protein